MGYNEVDNVYTFRFVRDAQREVNNEIQYYIDNVDKFVADRLLQKIETTVELLTMWPNSGRNVEGIEGLQYTNIPKFPYRLYFMHNENALEVLGLSLYHSARDQDYIQDKITKRISMEVNNNETI